MSAIKYTDEYRENRLAQLGALSACIVQYCEVVPTWGVEEVPKHLHQIGEMLDVDSYDAALLCLEHGGMLLTLDGRLRELVAVMGGIVGVWPQVFCAAAAHKGLCSPDSYHELVFASLAKRRSHVAINASSIVWLLGRPQPFKAVAGKCLLEYLCDIRVDRQSAIGIVAETIKMVILKGGTLGAMATLLQQLGAALFARKDASADGSEALLRVDLQAFLELVFDAQSIHHLDGGADANPPKISRINKPYKRHVDEACGVVDGAWCDLVERAGDVLRSRSRSPPGQPWPSAGRAALQAGHV